MAVFARLDEAEVARGLLVAEGIPVALLDRHAAWGFGGSPGAVRLLVPTLDLQRAQGLLARPPQAGGQAAPAPTPFPGALGAWERPPDDGSSRGAVRVVLWLAGLAATAAAFGALL